MLVFVGQRKPLKIRSVLIDFALYFPQHTQTMHVVTYSYTFGIMPEFTFAGLLMHVLKDAMRNPHIWPEYYTLLNGNFGRTGKCLMILAKC